MSAEPNAYCTQLGIAVPSLAAVRTHPEANTYTLLIITLLEHGRPMTLAEVAAQFAAAGVVEHEDDAYFALKRCRPARPPVYRDGDHYALDPHDADLDLWAFRLGLRPPRVARPAPTPTPPRPPADQPLTVAELDTAWRGASLLGWSAQRLALAVLDAHARPMQGVDVVAFVTARTEWHKLRVSPMPFRLDGAAVAVAADGAWSIVPGVPELGMARNAVRDAVERAHRRPTGSSPEEVQANIRAAEKRRTSHADALAALRRVIVHAFPPRSPRAIVLVDVEQRTLTTLLDDQLATVAGALAPYDIVCGVDIRATLRELGVDATTRRLAELGPPQKSIRLNRGGRTLKITPAMLVQGSCGISRPFGDDAKLRAYLAKGQLAQLVRRLEADAKSLYALHQYGKVHGYVRLRWGFVDEKFPAPWHHRDEPTLHDLKREADALALGLIAVVGAAPGWEQPWARERHLDVVRGTSEYHLLLVDEFGDYVDDRDVQLARLETLVH